MREENITIEKVTNSKEQLVDKENNLTEKVIERKIIQSENKDEEPAILQTYLMSDGTLETDLTFLSDFHLPTYEEYKEQYPMPAYFDSFFHTWGHLPLTYDYKGKFEESEHGELLIFDYNRNLILKQVEHPAEKFSMALACGRCHRTIADLLADQKLSHFFYVGILEKEMNKSFLSTLGARTYKEASKIADKIESGIPQIAKPNADLGFLCGNCLSVHYTDWASNPFQHNYDWTDQKKLERAKFFVDTNHQINQKCYESVLEFTESKIEGDKIVLAQSVKNRIYFDKISPEELKFVKDMGITVRESADYDALYFLA